jgi:hypothetical protein
MGWPLASLERHNPLPFGPLVFAELRQAVIQEGSPQAARHNPNANLVPGPDGNSDAIRRNFRDRLIIDVSDLHCLVSQRLAPCEPEADDTSVGATRLVHVSPLWFSPNGLGEATNAGGVA